MFAIFNFNPALADDEKYDKKSEQCVDAECSENVCPVKQEPSEEEILNAKNVEALKKFLADFEKIQNKHNLSALKNLYTDDFVNSDGYNKTQLFNLISQTLKNYPDIKNDYEVEEIIANGNYATVFLNQTVNATTKTVSQITNDKGEYTAKLKVVEYLKKYNNKWKIYAEDVNYEFSSLAYGSAKGVVARVNTPQKVLAGNDYCAGVEVKIPDGYNAMASINSTQLVENFKPDNEKYRSMPAENTSLERVLKANNDNNNEAVVIAVGFTKQDNDMFKKPKIELSGLLMILKICHIIAANTNLNVNDKK